MKLSCETQATGTRRVIRGISIELSSISTDIKLAFHIQHDLNREILDATKSLVKRIIDEFTDGSFPRCRAPSPHLKADSFL